MTLPIEQFWLPRGYCTFKQAQRLAREVCGEVPRTRLWNALVSRYKEGKSIEDFATMALVASVVGDQEAPLFVATIQDIYGRRKG